MDDAGSVVGTADQHHISSFLSPTDDVFADEPRERRCMLVMSANDAPSLRSSCHNLVTHLINPAVRITLRDLAYTLSERRTHHFHRAYVVTQNRLLDERSFIFGNIRHRLRVGYIFTGQGAQWSQMGKELIRMFPVAQSLLTHLDNVLQSLPNPPHWSLQSKPWDASEGTRTLIISFRRARGAADRGASTAAAILSAARDRSPIGYPRCFEQLGHRVRSGDRSFLWRDSCRCRRGFSDE